MHSRIRLQFFILSFILFSFHCILGFSQSPQYENKIIEKITVVLNTSSSTEFNAESIKIQLKTKEGEHFSQSEFDNDLKALTKNFDEAVPEISIINDKLHITLTIILKPIIRTIYWTGNQKIKTKCLEKELQIPLRTVYDRHNFNKAFHKLKTYYVKEGFFEAELDYQVKPDPLCNEVDIEISIVEGRAGRIKKILFSGVDPCEMQDILGFMVTKRFNFFTSWLTGNGTYNENAINQDQFFIVNYFQNKGYADARVKIHVSESQDVTNRIIICIEVEKGAIYRIGEITFEGNILCCDQDVIKRFTIKSGDPYSPQAINRTAEAIKGLYGKCGYIDARVDYEPKLIDDECTYSLHFTISEGEQFRVGMIKVLGNCVTETNVILHETLLIPGQIFNSEKLEATEARLKNVGFFQCVNVYAVKSENCSTLGSNYRDVHVEVEEAATGHIGGSVGGSSTEGFFAGINLTENNFSYKGLSRIFCEGRQAIRGGGEYAHLNFTFGKKSRSYIFSWTKPYFMDTPWSIGFDLENSSTRYISKDYNILANGFTLYATNQLNPFLRLGYHYRLRNTNVRVKSDVPRKEREQLHSDGLISAAGTSLIYDSTDHPLRPTCGFKSRLDCEVAGFGGRYQFFSIAYLNSYYIPVKADAVVKFRADARFIQPMLSTQASRIPIDERLFLGGDNFVRGYRAYKLGPQFKKTHDAKGALSLQFLSVEYSRRVFKMMDFFLFCDAGAAVYDVWQFGRIRAAAGFGFRVKILGEASPPLEIGFGIPLNPKRKNEIKKFFINVGAKF